MVALVPFETRRADFSLRSFFAAPQFGLFTAVPRMLEAFYSRLTPFGLKLADVRIEGNAANPASFVASYSLPANQGVIKVRLADVEVTFAFYRHDTPAEPIASAALEAVKETSAGMYKPVVLHTLTWSGHGALETMTPADFLHMHVKKLPFDQSREAGVAVGFTLSADQDAGLTSANVILTPSPIVQNTLLLQLVASYDGKRSLRDAVQHVGPLLRGAAEVLGLAFKGQ